MKEFKGQLAGFPEEVVEKMLERQVMQGNKCNYTLFEAYAAEDKYSGGFTWKKTSEGHEFWESVIERKNFDLFFSKYPKVTPASEYPKIMMVSDKPIRESNKGYKRVVFMEKCGEYLAWQEATTIEYAANILITSHWKYAVDVHDQPIVELTLTQVAEKFGVPVDKLRIKE